MAPSKRNDHAQDTMMKDEVFGRVVSMSKVPASYIPLKQAEREYGLRLQVYLSESVIYTGQSVKTRLTFLCGTSVFDGLLLL